MLPGATRFALALFLASAPVLAQSPESPAPAAAAPTTTSAPTAAEARHADHEELRAMMRAATAALNSRNFDQLSPLVSDHVYITTVDGRTFDNLAGFKSYLDQLFANRVKKLDFAPNADELTLFLGDNDGLSRGSSVDTYTFTDGESRVMKSRWTASVHREPGGPWKLTSLHIGANVLDNPVVDATKKFAWMAGAGALIAGLILGYLLRSATARKN